MDLFVTREDCCGCGACKAVCVKEAIVLVEDEDGFRYPEINEDNCIMCGACQRVCPMKFVNGLNKPIDAYVATNKDFNQLMRSASGGVFSALATKALMQEWLVWGAAYVFNTDGMIDVKHRGIKKLEELPVLQGSKYVQSNTDDIYGKIKQQLRNNHKVLFSGTPCQVAALKKSIGDKAENLFTIDIICHGVPNVKMFNDYLKESFGENKEKICDFCFRDKYSGWGMTAVALIKDYNGKVRKKRISSKNSSFFSLFLQSKIYRESCYSCPYATGNREGDLTIGDYWGIQSAHPELLNDKKYVEEKGISCILVNTNKGKMLLNDLGSGLNLNPSTSELIMRENNQLKYPSKMPADYEKIKKEYRENGFKGFESELRKNLGYKYWLNCIIVSVPANIKKMVKKSFMGQKTRPFR